MNAAMHEVHDKMEKDLENASTDEEREDIIRSYNNWKWTFPQGIVDKTEKNLQKARIERKIKELQEVYDKLN